MNLFQWFSRIIFIPSMNHEVLWSCLTITLSLGVCLGYGVIAFNWYFQSKLARHAEARAALKRLRNISLSCAACGFLFYLLESPWLIWRLYDCVLLLLIFYTWSFVLKMRGLSLLDERLAQMDELEKAATKYREIAELLPHMVWTANADGQVDFSNKRWREYVGSDQRSWLEAVHPEEQEAAQTHWKLALLNRQAISFELRLGGAGGYRTFLVKATPVTQGDAIKWLGACADIEDQKQLAQQQEMQARQKSFFLNALSHDLRAPLHNVLLNAQLLKITARDESDAESVQMIVENAMAAGDLITKLLEFAKAGAEDHNAIEPVYVTAILNQIARRFIPLAEQKQLALRVDATVSEYLTIHTDRQKLERILGNLVENAIKYTQTGSIVLSVRNTAAGAQPREMSFCVTDTGVGIPSENVPFLFEEFYQVNNYERDRSKGFGMGLAICRRLARQIGGDVRLAGSSSDGSCFEIIVPADLRAAVRADRGGRQGGAAGDLRDPAQTRLCRL